MEIISRKHYADKVDSWLGKEHVIVLVGQRRVGKAQRRPVRELRAVLRA